MSTYTKLRSVDGGFVVLCKLCGKRSTQVFKEDRYDNPHRAAVEYLNAHTVAPEHTAAVGAYRAEDAPPETADAALLRKIFGGPEQSEQQRRRAAAKTAAAFRRRA